MEVCEKAVFDKQANIHSCSTLIGSVRLLSTSSAYISLGNRGPD